MNMSELAAEGLRVQVVGLGLIGASIGFGLRAAGVHVAGVDAEPAVAARAVELGAVDVADVDSDAAVTFIATPAVGVADAAAAALGRGGVVTDVAGVKGPVVSCCGPHPRFVGGHPFAGSHRCGPDAGDATLFSGAAWALTPTEVTDPAAVEHVAGLVRMLGASPVVMDAAAHDRLAATSSHVPHLVAAALTAAAGVVAESDRRLVDVVAGGFADMTRVAGSPVSFWPSALVANRAAVLDALDGFASQVERLRAAVAAGDESALGAFLEAVRVTRSGFVDTGTVLAVDVVDATGAVAAVLDAVAAAGVNVADVDLIPHLDSPGATLHLTVAQGDGAAAVAAVAAAGLVARPVVDGP